MKYGFYVNQIKAVELGLNFQQTLLITCIHDLMGVSKYEKNEKHEVFITHSIFLEEYPLLGFKGRTSFYNKFKELEELGFITKSTMNLKQNHKKNFYGLTAKSDELFTNVHNSEFTNVQKSEFTNVQKNHNTNVQKSEHNHYTITNNKKEINKEKKSRGVFSNVFLSEEELERLVKEHDLELVTKTIEKLSKYKKDNNKEYKDDNRTIRNWLKKEKTSSNNVKEPPTYNQKKYAKRLLIENIDIYSKKELSDKIKEVITEFPWVEKTVQEMIKLNQLEEITVKEWYRFRDRKKNVQPLCKDEKYVGKAYQRKLDKC